MTVDSLVAALGSRGAFAYPVLSIQTQFPAHLRDGSKAAYTRGTRMDDCFAAALATVLQVPIDDVPDPHLDERLARGDDPAEVEALAKAELIRWLDDRRLRMTVHRNVPLRRRRWIGVVPVRGWFQSHCLVMDRSDLLLDPARGFTPGPDGQEHRPLFGVRHIRFGLSFTRLPQREMFEHD